MINQREAVTEAVALLAMLNDHPGKAKYAVERIPTKQLRIFIGALKSLHQIAVAVYEDRKMWRK